MKSRACAGALLSAALLLAQGREPRLRGGELIWFTLKESKEEITRTLGRPGMVADFGNDFRSWQYQLGNVDHDEFSHQLVFRKSTGELISVTVKFESERNVDALFPEQETAAYFYPDAKRAQYTLRLRRLPQGRVLMAMGVSRAGQPTGQLTLMKETEIRHFYPWVAQASVAAPTGGLR